MRKTYLAAAVMGLALVAGQAVASEGDVLRLGDRVGSTSASQSHLHGLPFYTWFFAASLAAFLGYELSHNGGAPASP